jgi:hypothetical protein
MNDSFKEIAEVLFVLGIIILVGSGFLVSNTASSLNTGKISPNEYHQRMRVFSFTALIGLGLMITGAVWLKRRTDQPKFGTKGGESETDEQPWWKRSIPYPHCQNCGLVENLRCLVYDSFQEVCEIATHKNEEKTKDV